jgi:hypothetical protein
LVRTGTTSKWFATNPRPNTSIEGTSTSGLRPLAAVPHVKRQAASFWRFPSVVLLFSAHAGRNWFSVGESRARRSVDTSSELATSRARASRSGCLGSFGRGIRWPVAVRPPER